MAFQVPSRSFVLYPAQNKAAIPKDGGSFGQVIRQSANGSGRSWNVTSLLFSPSPPSWCQSVELA